MCRADVILSLTRTLRVGYLRDIRRLTVALSRARLGLYILGRRDIYESCYELKEAFQLLFQRPDKLMLTTGEMFPTGRLVVDEVEATEMTGIEHLGQYVFQMTTAKVEALKRGEKVGVGLIELGEEMPGIEETPGVEEMPGIEEESELFGEEEPGEDMEGIVEQDAGDVGGDV